jgi:hypothetical protein
MKLYRFWQLEKCRIFVDGEEKEVKIYGGSNLSLEDAARNARDKAEKITRKIEGDDEAFFDYEVEIREEILEEVRSDAVVTRNRYGARVLNVEKMLIMDIDQPQLSFGDIFRRRTPEQNKAKIFEMVRKLATTKYSALGFRVYETFQGARVIVLGRDFDPRESETIRMMKEFNCDPLYTMLCTRQACFRARLTPKPARMKMRGHKFVFPREGNDAKTEQWLAEYESAGQNFSVCKFIEEVGSSQFFDSVVRLHDDATGALRSLPLA